VKVLKVQLAAFPFVKQKFQSRRLPLKFQSENAD